ncbi:hypothetical protein ACN38_g3940 [Penicillium nordicum]|uniref:Uncharacterized protein n=1 Tax=Penicillium nordicum TaxID=229535 RepID=A0A0M8P4B3_9EURO|nr:hypothetical protein ACN38_g3940 [Penicillium nordicum]
MMLSSLSPQPSRRELRSSAAHLHLDNSPPMRHSPHGPSSSPTAWAMSNMASQPIPACVSPMNNVTTAALAAWAGTGTVPQTRGLAHIRSTTAAPRSGT